MQGRPVLLSKQACNSAHVFGKLRGFGLGHFAGHFLDPLGHKGRCVPLRAGTVQANIQGGRVVLCEAALQMLDQKGPAPRLTFFEVSNNA